MAIQKKKKEIYEDISERINAAIYSIKFAYLFHTCRHKIVNCGSEKEKKNKKPMRIFQKVSMLLYIQLNLRTFFIYAATKLYIAVRKNKKKNRKPMRIF